MLSFLYFKKNKINIKDLKFEKKGFLLSCGLFNNGWDKAIEGCDFVMHVASWFRIAIPKNEDEMILPAPSLDHQQCPNNNVC